MLLYRNNLNFIKFTFIILFILLPAALFPAGLHTVDYNYINDFIGGRATGMAGAYTAISDDPSGMYYNPAGLVFAYDNQISLSVNSYKAKNIKMKDAVGNKPYTQNSSTFYPSFFGVVQSLGKMRVGLSFMTINNEILDQDDYFPGISAYADDSNPYPADFRINYNITDSTLLGGFGIAGFFTDTVSWGISLLAMHRGSQQIANMLIRFDKTSVSQGITYFHSNTYITESINGAFGKVGFQYMPLPVLSIGYSFTYGAVLSHKYDEQYFIKAESATSDMQAGGYISGTNSVMQKNSRLPMTHRFGLAYFPSGRIVISADVIADLGTKYYQNHVNNTINYAIGSEFFVTRTLPVRFGIFTNFANTPAIDKNYVNQEIHVDMYGASASIGWETKSTSMSICGFYQYGKGESQIVSGITDVQETAIQLYSVSLTGTAKY